MKLKLSGLNLCERDIESVSKRVTGAKTRDATASKNTALLSAYSCDCYPDVPQPQNVSLGQRLTGLGEEIRRFHTTRPAGEPGDCVRRGNSMIRKETSTL